MRAGVVALVVAVAATTASCRKAEPVVLAELGHVSSLTADAAYVYAAQVAAGRASIVRVPVGGGPPETLFADTGVASGLMLDDGRLYWAEASDGHGDRTGRIFTAPATGGTPRELGHFTGAPVRLAADASALYVSSVGEWLPDGGIDVSRGSVQTLPKAGGEVAVLVDHLARPRDLVLGADDVYWLADDQQVWSVPKRGGAPAMVPASPALDYTDDADDKSIIVGRVRYRAVPHAETKSAVLTAERL